MLKLNQGLRSLGWCALANAVVFACIFSFLITPSFAQQSGATLVYKLGTGDQLRITVFGQPDLSGDVEVSSTGSVSLPLIGEIKAEGLTLKQLETAIIQRLKPDYLKNPQVSVEVLNYRPFYIIGEVKTPGSYPYVGGMRVVNAVAMAGGFTYRAREKSLLITRASDPDRKPQPATQDTVVLPGDIIEVPERFF